MHCVFFFPASCGGYHIISVITAVIQLINIIKCCAGHEPDPTNRKRMHIIQLYIFEFNFCNGLNVKLSYGMCIIDWVFS